MFMVKSFLRMFPGMSAAIANDNPNVTVMDGARNVSSDVTAAAALPAAAARTYFKAKRKADDVKLSAAAEPAVLVTFSAVAGAAEHAAARPLLALCDKGLTTVEQKRNDERERRDRLKRRFDETNAQDRAAIPGEDRKSSLRARH